MDESESPQITLEELAAITAALDAGLPRSAVLAEAGLSDEAWEAAQRECLSRLARHASQGKLGASQRYVELFGAQRALAAAKAAKARKQLDGPIPVAPSVVLSPLAAVVIARPEPAVSPRVEMPIAPSVRPSAPPPAKPRNLGETAAIDRSVVAAAVKALPFAKPAAPAPGDPTLDTITLREYANICAGVRAYPDNIAWVVSRYAFSEKKWERIHAIWQERLQRDPTLAAEWERLIHESLPHWKR